MYLILSRTKRFRAVCNDDLLKEYVISRRSNEEAIGWIRYHTNATGSRWMFDSLPSPLSVTDLLELSSLVTNAKECYQRSILGDDFIED
jgi:hypothetical protein